MTAMHGNGSVPLLSIPVDTRRGSTWCIRSGSTTLRARPKGASPEGVDGAVAYRTGAAHPRLHRPRATWERLETSRDRHAQMALHRPRIRTYDKV